MQPSDLTRRQLLALAAGTGTAGVLGAVGLGAFDREGDASTTEIGPEESRRLAETFAPVYYFDRYEKWFPTDPRPYESEAEGDPVVDGFAAFNGYTEQFQQQDAPPEPTVFYHVVGYEDSTLAAVQYWWYAAFDQFSVNFHWHDWELTQVFVDRETEEPKLFVGSAHSRKVPNNEFLGPEETEVPRILPELGSHSGGISVNRIEDRFTRNPAEEAIADVTNAALEEVSRSIPAAYGLPRDEGFRLPYVVPELDGEPIYDHDRLPAVNRSSLVDERLTVRSFEDLSRPPEDLPERETGRLFAFDPADADGEVDVRYDLTPTTELEHITAFTGPQLSFEFTVPEFAEDQVASHITTTKVPWTQPRYENPATDISDPAHRQALADEYDAIGEPSPANRLVVAVRQVETDDGAPENEGVTTSESTTEKVVRADSDPVAVPTFAGVAVVEDLPPGEHRLTVNGAGEAPHSERVEVTEGPGADLAGVDGEIALTPNEAAVKLEVDADGTEADLQTLAVEDDFAGRLYDAPMEGPDAVYVHQGGAYTTEVRDADGAHGAFRVNPDPAGESGRDAAEAAARVRIETPDTGKASLSAFVSTISQETAVSVDAVTEVALDDLDPLGGGGGRTPTATPTGDGSRNGTPTPTDDEDLLGDAGRQTGGVTGLLRALKAVLAAADRATEAAAAGDRQAANRALETVAARLADVRANLEGARRDLPEPTARAVEARVEQAIRRTEQARETEKL
ncbi:hypothetical protein BRC75_09685 [Halobacteriales archaeon QH_7_69_31]|nr:MAG: hypothetical protein BRC75_09685 [Halobacteriales archaeon QH_7_69_31]